jgi:membrane associated rhomboid family serine protease
VIPIPISDENPASRTPWVTYALIAVNALAWFFELSRGVFESTFDYGAIPSFVLHGVRDGVLHIDELKQGVITLHQEVPWPMTVLTSMFMHGGWLHIIGNMWFLWIFGDNIEDILGRGKYVVFYLACGAVAGLTQSFLTTDPRVPMVGASGAIAGVMGAYMLKFPHSRIVTLVIVIFFFTTIDIPAWVMLIYWFVTQFFSGVGSIAYSHVSEGGGVAFFAHVGGFVMGAILISVMGTNQRYTRRRDLYW